MTRSIYKGLMILCVFILAACSSVEDQVLIDNTIEDIETQALVTTSDLLQPIVFQISREAENQLTGWVITRTGRVLSYDVSQLNTDDLPFNQNPTINQLQNLIGKAQATGTVIDMQELSQYADLIANATEGELTSVATDYDQSETLVFYAYNVITERHSSNSEEEVCNDCGTNSTNVSGSVTTHSYQRVMLQSEGIINQSNESTSAETIQTWLAQMLSKGGLG